MSLKFWIIMGSIAILLGACDFIPGTNSYQESKARDAVARELVDPSSAQFRNTEVRGDMVCGEVNGKNRMGAYVGFQRFYVRTSNWDAVLDPQFNPQDLASARSLCLSGARFDTSSCNRQVEEEAKQTLQLAFNATWAAQCVRGGAPASQLPFDPTRFNDAANSSTTGSEPTNGQVETPILDVDSTSYASPAEGPLVDADGNPLSSTPTESSANDQLNQNWLDRAIGHSTQAPSSNVANQVKQ
jgi:hypothetical protein